MSERGQLTRIDDRLVLSPDGQPPIIRFDEVMHFGRGVEVKDYKARVTPESLKDATFAVQVVNPDRSGRAYVSRNHFLMYPPGAKGGLDEDFGLRDLNSLNSTSLNGVNLQPGKLVRVVRGDVVKMLPDMETSLEFKFEEVADDVNVHHALMVGYRGWNLKGVDGDVRDLKKEIDKRGFGDNVRTLLKQDASVEKILGILEHIRLQVTRNSIFIFHFSGHGSRRGEILVRPSWQHKEGLLKANLVYNILRQFRGKVLLILDGCYTDMFIDSDMPDNVSVIGHSGKAYEGKVTCRPGEDELIRGYMTRAIVKALRSNPRRVRIPDLVRQVQEDPRVKIRQKLVHRPANHGSTVMLHSERL